MKNVVFGTILLALVSVFPTMTMAAVDISIGISLPPPIVFAAPPEVIVIPDTYVYVVPDLDADIFFYGGWWWRPWEGRWYRSRYYDRGWGYYSSVPTFYFDVDPGWRVHYRNHDWYGHRWEYERIPHQRLQQNWNNWHKDRHWERRGTWGVQNYKPRPQQQRQELRQQRQQQYQQRPEVQQHQQQNNSNRDNSNKNHRFGSHRNSSLRFSNLNLKVISDSLRFSNLRNGRDNLRSSSLNNSNSKDKNLRFSNLNTLSLKENLKNGRGNIESRMTKSLKHLISNLSVGQARRP